MEVESSGLSSCIGLGIAAELLYAFAGSGVPMPTTMPTTAERISVQLRGSVLRTVCVLE